MWTLKTNMEWGTINTHYIVNHSGTVDTCEAVIRWFKKPNNPIGCQTTNEIESMFGQLKQWKGANRKEMGKSQEMGC